ncbi:MAG TPA: DUF4920 domain-containing protein [Thermoanaerobaculia bacterium]|jgi:Na+-transporting methylmalonyl-CoA/oxaloacetate decarboxylase gamma subunit
MKKATLLILLLLAAVTAFAGEVVKRGAPIASDARAIPFAEVLAQPDQYTKTPVVIEGLVEAACTNKGCWMQVVPEAGKSGMRVTFKDYAFFVPKDSKGMAAKMEGVVTVKTLSKEDAEHLEGEGAKLNRNADGTAREISFVATGVELKK